MSSTNLFIKNDLKVPSIPTIAIRVLEAVKDDKISFDELAGIISSDPALAARTLTLANSSFYGLQKKVENIQAALSILGTNTIKNIALSFTLSETFQGKSDNYFDYQLFWKRSLTAAVGAQLMSSIVGKNNDDYFITSLLQDIGIVIMYICKPEQYIQVLDEKNETGKTTIEIEQQIFGFDHQELGSDVLEMWGLPQTIFGPMRYHHEVNKAPQEIRGQSCALFCSDLISSFYHGDRNAAKVKTAKDTLCNDYGVLEKSYDELMDAIAVQSSEVISFFDIDKLSIKPYSEILQEANEELSKLNLSNARLIAELKASKEDIEKLNKELRRANVKLKEMAVTDGLTGLFNHKYFYDALEIEIERVKRYKNPLSLILFDIDYFKQVNDEFGHQAGDQVLRLISKIAAKIKRDTDILSRYGGEEFAVILSATDMKGAVIFAERLRKFVENTEFPFGDQKIKITISLGVTSYTSSSKIRDKEKVISEADKALYSSKNNGRNRVSISKDSVK